MKVEVKETQSNEVDWSKNPQLVVNKRIVVLTHRKQFGGSTFSGTCVSHLEKDELFVNHGDYKKSDFKPFHGTITIQND
jgi:hypothetical protein